MCPSTGSTLPAEERLKGETQEESMLNSEKLAIAAHLHVLLRRKTGRVTDTGVDGRQHRIRSRNHPLCPRGRARTTGMQTWVSGLPNWSWPWSPAPHPVPPAAKSCLACWAEIRARAPLPGASDSLMGASKSEAHRYIRGIR